MNKLSLLIQSWKIDQFSTVSWESDELGTIVNILNSVQFKVAPIPLVFNELSFPYMDFMNLTNNKLISLQLINMQFLKPVTG